MTGSMVKYRSQAGVTLIEVLVAVLVLAIGILGVAGLQSVSLKNTADVHFIHQVIGESEDIMNRIMANPAAANAGAYAATPPASAPTNDCSAVQCSTNDLAVWDLWQWSQELTNGFGAPPSAGANIVWDAASGEYEIAITWDANGAGAGYTAPTCTETDNSSAGCLFTVYRVAR